MAGSGPKAPFAPLAARFRQNVLFLCFPFFSVLSVLFRAFCSFPVFLFFSCFLQYTANLFFSQANVRKQIRLICHGRRFLPQGNRASDQNPFSRRPVCRASRVFLEELRKFWALRTGFFKIFVKVRIDMLCAIRYDIYISLSHAKGCARRRGNESGRAFCPAGPGGAAPYESGAY